MPRVPPGGTAARRSARYPMMPAHSSGASSWSLNPVGSGCANASATSMYSAYPPWKSQPVYTDAGHRFSWPRRQNRHDPSVPPSQAAPTRSPTLNRRVPGPAATTSATTSWPGVVSGCLGGRSPSARCRSVRQTPQQRILSSSWPGPGSGTGRSVSWSGPVAIGPGWWTTHARTDLGYGRPGAVTRGPSVIYIVRLSNNT